MVRKRPDRTEKIKLRKTTSETVVKSSLLKYIKGNDKNFKNRFQEVIQKRVHSYSQRMNLASIALSGIVKELYSKENNLKNLDLSYLLDATFIRQLILGPESSRKQMLFNLQNYFNDYPELQRVKDRQYYDLNIYSYGCKKYLTNLKNSLKMNLIPRIKEFIKKYSKINNLEDNIRVGMLYHIFGWNMPEEVYENYALDEDMNQIINLHRNILGLKEDEIIYEDKCSNENILKYFILLNQYYEEHKLPLFNIVPICNLKNHYITIDALVFYGIIKELNIIDCNFEVFKGLSHEHWNSIIDITKLQGKNNKFTGLIETDGIVMSTHFIRPKNINDDLKTVEIKNTNRVVAIDPGRVNIFYGVEKNEDGSLKTYKLTRGQYYCESGTTKANKITKIWQKNIQNELIKLSKVSLKGCSIEQHRSFLKVYFEVYDALWNENKKSRWSRQRFRLYGGKKRTFAKFCNSIKNYDSTREVVLAYGSAKFASGGKKEISVPTTRAFKECKERFPIKIIDEFRTSKIHYEDDSILQKVRFNDAKRKDYWLRGLLWCSSPNKSKFVSRDLNAALNILRCAINPIRPLILQRNENNQKIKDVLGKIIKRCYKPRD